MFRAPPSLEIAMSVLASLFSPTGFAIALLVCGLLAAFWRRRPGLAIALLAASGIVVTTFSSGMVAAALMSPLEYAYPSIHDARAHPEARHIVVLTGWAADDAAMPLTGRFNASSAYRVLMALELRRDRPDCGVIVSGDRKTARIMGEALEKLGVPREMLRLEDGGSSTADSARLLAPLVADDPFFLVTSAGHLPRTMEEMQRVGLRAVPVPTDHQLPRDWRRADWKPSPMSLYTSELAIHEYLGRAWRWLRSD
jgi:uncharacterized SAM-binding protein YcdF (DUF218 family)